MMNKPPNISQRFSRHVVALLGVSLFVSLPGCRGLSSRSDSTLMPVPPPLTVNSAPLHSPANAEPLVPVPVSVNPATVYNPPLLSETASLIGATDGPSAFRPIMPEQSALQTVTVAKPVSEFASIPQPLSEPATVEPANAQQQVDALNHRVAQLQKELEESEERNRQIKAAQKAVEDAWAEKNEPAPIPAVLTEIAKPDPLADTLVEPKPVRKAPTLNISGVTVTSENEEIRFRVIDSVLFVPGTQRLSPEAEQTLRRIVAEIRTLDSDLSLEIEGHTDSLNVDPANPMQKHDLSTIKAVAVMEYFVKSLLWNPEKIRTSSYGPAKPVGDNGTPEGRQQNNRVEIVVLP